MILVSFRTFSSLFRTFALMNKKVGILYYLLTAVTYLLSLLPLRVLYIISDILFFFIYYIGRYRRRLVRKNLSDSFPEKSISEILRIERCFYAWFCDYIVETVKLYSIRESEIRHRMRFTGIERMEQSIQNGQSCILYLGHYCNWEWISSFPLWLGEHVDCGQIYHVLENPDFDKLMLSLRGRFHASSIPMADTLRYIVKARQEHRTIVLGFISDQVPLWNNIHYWTDFLHHDTPVLTGGERLARKMDFVVYYGDIRREKRGQYVCDIKLLNEHPATLPEFGLTEIYMRALEKTIQRQPEFWLWTHNRWKRTREEWKKIIQSRMV